MIKPNDIPNSMPEISAIYRVWHQGQVVYVGQAKNLKKRWKKHEIYPKLYTAYQSDWAVDFVQVQESLLNRAEAFAYRHFKPTLNRRDPSALLGKEDTSTPSPQVFKQLELDCCSGEQIPPVAANKSRRRTSSRQRHSPSSIEFQQIELDCYGNS